MSHKGYALESEIENFFLSFTGQTKHDPILKADGKGLIRLNRSFRIPTSGAMDSMAGDVITAIPQLNKQFKVECKSRYQKNKKEGQIIMIERAWIKKNEEEAALDNQISTLCFSFKRVKVGRLWWVIRVNDFITQFGDAPGLRTSGQELKFKKGKTFKFVWGHLVVMSCAYFRFKHPQTNENYFLIPHEYFAKLIKKATT